MKFLILAYLALYWTIYFHELGHSYVYKKYGCKKEFFMKVTVPWTLLFSSPLPIDEEKSKRLTDKQNLNIAMAGVLVNLVFALFTAIPLLFIKITTEVNIMFLYLICIFNLAQASSYLFINNIFLASDMKIIANINPKLRILGLIIGLITSVGLVYFITLAPMEFSILTIISTVVIVICMSLGRVIYDKNHN